MSRAVTEALREMQARRWDRAMGDLFGGNRQEALSALRTTMFSRRKPGEAFHPLNLEELAFLESVVEGYEVRKNFLVPQENCSLAADYALIRHNHISGQKIVTPSEFRAAADRITGSLMDFVKTQFGISAGTAIVIPWRAALSFVEPALAVGIRDFYHLGACRDEGTLETNIYFEEVPPGLQRPEGHSGAGIVADPMLATGNTAIVGISRLLAQGVPEKNIIVLAVISAPEAIDHIFEQFPAVRIIAGNHDECLNSNGYIVPGLGDFGDLYFDHFDVHVVHAWHSRGILSDTAHSTLLRRMTGTGSAA